MSGIKSTLESIRVSIAEESISYGEIAYLQSHIDQIDPDDDELLYWATDNSEYQG